MKTTYFIASGSVMLSRPINRIGTLRRVFKRLYRRAPSARMFKQTIFR